MFYVHNKEKEYTHNIALHINLPAEYTALGKDLDFGSTTCHLMTREYHFEAYQLKAHSIFLRPEAILFDLYFINKWLNWHL